MDFKLVLVIITIILSAVIALVVYVRNPRSDVAKSFVLLISSFILWASAQVVMHISSSSQTAVIAVRFANVFAMFIAWAFLLFCYRFPHRTFKLNYLLLIAFLILTMISLALSLHPSGIFIGSIPAVFGHKYIINKLAYGIYAFIFFAIFGYGFYFLLGKYYNSAAENKILVRYVLYSSFIPVLAGVFFNMILFFFDRFEYQIYGPTFTLIFTLTVFYLIFLRPKLT